jgi:hypothetical protein
MHLGVAIEAGPTQHEAIAEVVICQFGRVGHAGMAGRRVALLAQQRRPADQHRQVVAAVRPVTERAILGCRRMLPQEWAALFRVAEIAGLVDGRLAQQRVIVAVVRVVTAGAGHAAEPQWMVAGAVDVSLALLVATETGLLLCQRIEDAVPAAVDLVAGRAGQVLGFVRAPEPAQPAVTLVALQANCILFGCRRGSALTEHDHGLYIAAPTLGSGMILARAVAGFALQLPEWRRRVVPCRVRRIENRHCRQGHAVLMAGNAGIRAAMAVLTRQREFGFCGRLVGPSRR